VPKRLVDLRSQVPLLDIASYGRLGPGQRRRLSPAEIAHASRTARGVPEVMIKVSGGARTIRGVATHLDYLKKRADIETDDGVILNETGLGRELLNDWDLELDERPITPKGALRRVARHRNSSTTSCFPCPRVRRPTSSIRR
jgi:hypothetical protein